MLKVLIVAHGHPALSPGGAERAAYSLHQELILQPGFDSLFVAALPKANNRDYARVQNYNRSDRELLVTFPSIDPFDFMSKDIKELRNIVRDLVAYFSPDIVHMHHFVNIGLDIISIFKELTPNVKIVFSFHEYLLLCHNFGQMKKVDGRLCKRRMHKDCTMCFNNIPSGTFFLREKYFLDQLRLCDAFHAPSHFLISQFQINEFKLEPMFMIENIQRQPRTHQIIKTSSTFRVGYFGQINRFKGLSVLMAASEEIRRRKIEGLTIDVFGNLYEDFDPPFTAKFKSWIDDASLQVRYHGAYDGEDVIQIMSGFDCIVVPSVWWENSPLIIQEAVAAGVWIVGSDIGGIKEKLDIVANGVTFKFGDGIDLLDKILYCRENKNEISMEKASSDLPLVEYIGLYNDISNIHIIK